VDGGNSWPTASLATTAILGIHFADANNGKIVGQAGGKLQLFTTSDGGADWSPSSSLSVNAGEISFLNASAWNGTNALIGTNQGEVYYTTDNNKWTHVLLSTQTGTKMKDAMAVGLSSDNTTGYCCVHGFTNATDSAGLFFSQTHGASWNPYTLQPVGFIPYGVTFIPGTKTAVITSNMGVFTLASPTDSLRYLAAPSSWSPSSSEISAAGTATNYTISGVSVASGIVDYTVGASSVEPASGITNGISIVNSPNPFSNSTTLYFSLPTDEHVRIRISDVLGRTVSEAFDGLLPAGQRAVELSLKDVMPGVYHCSIETENGEMGEKSIVLMR